MMFALAIIVDFAAVFRGSVENDKEISTCMVNEVNLPAHHPDVINFVMLINGETTGPWLTTTIVAGTAMTEAILL